MRVENTKGKILSRRSLILGGIKLSLITALTARLYYLQMFKSQTYKTLSDSNRIKLLLIPPLRGNILDRHGKALAANKNYYRVLLDPERAPDSMHIVDKLGTILNIPKDKQHYIVKKVKEHKSRRTMLLYEHLSWEDVAKVEVRSPDLPGVSIDVGQIRYYPYPVVTSHLIGYVGAVSERELTNDPLLNHPDFKIGKSGIERSLESQLRGKAGVKRIEVDAFGLSVRELSREDSTLGDNVQLTIDIALQDYVFNRLDKRGAAAVVIDIPTGDILALCSTPGFNPNSFVEGISSEYWKGLIQDEQNPLINKAIAKPYPPGSTFKIIVALAALADGFNPSTYFDCPGHYDLGNRRFHCWRKEGHGKVNLVQAIAGSCNVYFYNLARRVGIEKISAMAKKFALGDSLDIPLPEKKGVVPTKKWKRKTFRREWQVGDTLNSCIGQGFVLSTPIQLATMVARVASGRVVNPRLALDQSAETLTTFETLGIPKEHLRIVQRGMVDVVNSPAGTAYSKRITELPFAMAGKTGTSQVVSKTITDAILERGEKIPWKEKNHALFVGYAPHAAPRYAVCVVVEHGGSGSFVAAPVARDILLEAQTLALEKTTEPVLAKKEPDETI